MSESDTFRNSCLADILIFSAIGCCSYLLLITSGDIPARQQLNLLTPEAIVAVLLLFNGVGLGMRFVNRRIGPAYPGFIRDRRRIFLFFFISAAGLLVLNYLLLVMAKFIIGSSHLFALAWRGTVGVLCVWFMELILLSLFMMNRFYADLMSQYRRTRLLEESSAQARYAALQNQLNPHFLFNSLNTLVAEIEYNPPRAAEFTRNLADAYRYILDCHDRQTVTVSEELEFVDVYLQLQRVRMGECIDVDNRLDESVLEMNIPPLTLQLLIENVIKHNAITMARPMTVVLDTEKRSEDMWLTVSNRIQPKQISRTSGMGLYNLSQRYMLLCGHDIEVIPEKEFFTVKVPLIYE